MELILANANGILLYNLNNYTIEKMQSISNICNIDSYSDNKVEYIVASSDRYIRSPHIVYYYFE